MKKKLSFFFFSFILILQAQMQKIEVPQTLNSVINNKSSYLISDNYILDFEKKVDKNYINYTDFIKKYPSASDFPITTKSIWIKFTLENTKNTKQEIRINAQAHYLQLFELNNNQAKSLAVFGKFNKVKKYPFPDDPFNAPITLQPKEIKQFLLQTRQNNYSIFLPQIRWINEYTRIVENSQKKHNIPAIYNDFTLLVLGFLILFLLFCLDYFLMSRKKYFINLIILDLIYLIYFGTNYDIIHIEIDFLPRFSAYEIASYSGILFPPAYIIFLLSLVETEKNSFFKKAIYCSCFFYVILFIQEYSDFENPLISHIFQFISVYGVLYTAIVFTLLFIYLFKFKDFFYKAVNFGLLLNLFSTLLFVITFVNLRYNLNFTFIAKNYYNICLINELSVVLDFSIFMFALFYREKQIGKQLFLSKIALENENESLELKHSQIVSELKKLVEKDNIILKDRSKLNLEDLMIIKADDHYLNIVAKDGKNHLVRGKLTEIIQELPSNFVKCHRSYIINKNFVKQEQSKFILMSNNSEIPISRGFKF